MGPRIPLRAGADGGALLRPRCIQIGFTDRPTLCTGAVHVTGVPVWVTTGRSEMKRNCMARGFGAVMAAAIGLIGVAGTALADEVTDEAAPSLTVHRLRGAGKQPGTGEELTPAPNLLPVSGALIGLHKITCSDITDLSTDAQVEAARKMMEEIGPVPTKGQIASREGCSLSLIEAKTTPGSGIVSWNNLQRGLYYGEEAITPTGYDAADPFVAMLPMTTIDGSGLNWDVHVYPKSNRTGYEVRKAVLSQSDTIVNGLVKYAVRSEIHKYPEGLKSFVITDVLDERLFLNGEDSTTVSIGGKRLSAGTDYRVVSGAGDSRTIAMYLTAAGLKIYNAASPYGELVWEFDALLVGKGIVSNVAAVWENALIFEEEGPVIVGDVLCKEGMLYCVNTEPVEVRYGSANVLNTIYESNEPAVGSVIEVRYADVTSKVDSAAAKAQSCTGTLVDTLTTAKDGTATTVGTRSSEYLNGRKLTPDDQGYRFYCATQIKAPAGTELIRESRPFTIVGDTEADLFNTDLVFQNVIHNGGFRLPLTGGIGLGAFGLIGVLLMGSAVFQSRRTAHRAGERESVK